MRYKELGQSGIKLSVVGQGTWAMGQDMWGTIEDTDSIATIRKAVEGGINLIDTAPGYGNGHSEEVVGKAIRGIRDQVALLTKCGVYLKDGNTICHDLSPKAIRGELEQSLTRLGTDMIDIYIIHYPDPDTSLEESLAELAKLKQEGKVRCIGVSNFDLPLLKKALEITEIGCIQPQFSLLSRQNEEMLRYAHAHGVGVVTYGSLAAGMLTGTITKLPEFDESDARNFFYPFFKEPMFSRGLKLVDSLRIIAKRHEKPVSHVALNWVTQQEPVTVALVGAMKPQEAAENALAGTWELSTEELAEIDSAYQQYLAEA